MKSGIRNQCPSRNSDLHPSSLPHLDPLANNPFAVLSFIAAPALLTNTSSLLTLATSNRFARSVDRARALSARLESDPPDPNTEEGQLLLWQLESAELRVLRVIRALSAFYFAVGAFGLATLASLFGSALEFVQWFNAGQAAFWLALLTVAAGVGGLITGASLLVLESRLTGNVLRAEANLIRRRARERRK